MLYLIKFLENSSLTKVSVSKKWVETETKKIVPSSSRFGCLPGSKFLWPSQKSKTFLTSFYYTKFFIFVWIEVSILNLSTEDQPLCSFWHKCLFTFWPKCLMPEMFVYIPSCLDEGFRKNEGSIPPGILEFFFEKKLIVLVKMPII